MTKILIEATIIPILYKDIQNFSFLNILILNLNHKINHPNNKYFFTTEISNKNFTN